MKNKFMFAAALGSFVAANVYGAGFEKSVMWSGHEAGYAGSGQSRVNGSQSILFNPAGLAGSGRGDVSLNFSPSNIKLQGHLASTAKEEETDHNFSPIGGATAAYKLGDKLGFGVGAYVAAGNKAIYDSVDLTGDAATVTAFQPRISTDFAVMEYAIGGAYELSPGFRLGLAWRILKATGGLSTIKKTVTNTAYTYVNLVDLKDTKYNGFRLGAQYQAPDDSWGVGATFRNGVNFVAESGTNNGNVVVIPTNSVNSATVSNATVGTSLPTAYSLGANYKFSEDFRFLTDVDFVKYSKNDQLAINATLTSALLGGTVALPNIPLKWKDMWNFRVGGEYTGLAGMALRAGYSLTTRVTPKTDSRATISPSGLGHLFAVGAGTSIMKDTLALDGAFEYSFNSGNGAMSSTPAGSTTKELLADVSTDHKAKVMALHLGATYKF